jgi:hypothetical protein
MVVTEVIARKNTGQIRKIMESDTTLTKANKTETSSDIFPYFKKIYPSLSKSPFMPARLL